MNVAVPHVCDCRQGAEAGAAAARAVCREAVTDETAGAPPGSAGGLPADAARLAGDAPRTR
ncbi:MAG: hypothetical protein FGM25_15645 [Mycobacterium sp.]|nr:hypothetical protein [Mycobacterium sp.]